MLTEKEEKFLSKKKRENKRIPHLFKFIIGISILLTACFWLVLSSYEEKISNKSLQNIKKIQQVEAQSEREEVFKKGLIRAEKSIEHVVVRIMKLSKFVLCFTFLHIAFVCFYIYTNEKKYLEIVSKLEESADSK